MKIHAGIKIKSDDICLKVYYLYSKKFKLLPFSLINKFFRGKDYPISYFSFFLN